MKLKSGTTLQNGRFTILSCIGDGGFGITYLANDERLDREVVLKEYFPDHMVERDTNVSCEVHTLEMKYSDEFHLGIQKFLNEAKILARFNNIPGIADIYDFFPENNTAYIVMEYIKGGNLKSRIRARKTPYTFAEALKTLSPCMFALQKVHEAGIIHRDFAPDNILIDEKGQMKIIDFGSSRNFTGGSSTMTILVKHGYAPAEQYSSAAKQGPYTDVYSLGAIFYEMLTLEKPLPSVDRMFRDDLSQIIEINPSITKAQNDVVMKALSVSCETRYQSIDEFTKDLRSVENGTAATSYTNLNENDSTFKLNLNKIDSVSQSEPIDTGSTPYINTQYNNSINNYYYPNQYQIAPEPVPASKKSKIGLLIFIIAAVVMLGTVGVLYFINSSGSSETRKKSSKKTSKESEDESTDALADFLASSEMDSILETVNSKTPFNAYTDFGSEGPHELVLYYHLKGHMEAEKYTSSELEVHYDDMTSTYGYHFKIANTEFEKNNIEVKTYRVIIINDDGTILYDKTFNNNY